MSRGPDVVIENLSLDLGGGPILTDISHRFAAGKVHCILGPNGGGKTSLIRCLLGQMPFRGAIRLEGGEPGRFGYVPQALEYDRSLPLTVSDILAVMTERRPAFLKSKAAQRAAGEAALERVGFKEMRNRRFGALSGGERQRVLFAQALVPDPALLIMDEPTSNMDKAGVARLEEIVRELADAGTTVLWVNHDWAQARRVADSVVGIQGTVTFAGAPGQVLAKMMPEGMLS